MTMFTDNKQPIVVVLHSKTLLVGKMLQYYALLFTSMIYPNIS